MDPQLKKNLSNSHSWFRVFYVVIFVVAAEIAATIALILALLQILFSLITGQANDRLTSFGDSLAKFLYACYAFVVYKSEEKPFPFSDWPEGESNSIVAEGEIIEAPVQPEGPAEDKSAATEEVVSDVTEQTSGSNSQSDEPKNRPE